MRPASRYLGGHALPPAEWQAAERNGRLLIDTLAAHGSVMVSHDLGWLGECYRAKQPAPWGLARCLDRRWWPNDSTPERTLIVALMKDGNLMAASVARWIWLHGSLKEEHESGRFFYGDYAAGPHDGAQCIVSASTADVIARCAVVYSCGLHAEPALAAKDDKLSWPLVRLAHLLAGINWHFSWLLGRSKAVIAKRWNEPAWGFSLIENGIQVRRGDGSREEEYHLVGGRIDLMRRQFQRPEYGSGASLADHLPLFKDRAEINNAAGAKP